MDRYARYWFSKLELLIVDKPSRPTNLAFLLGAVDFAAKKHRYQQRKGEDPQPYINHPVEVAKLLGEHGIDDPDVLVAALLHDTIEDTETTADEIERHFNPRVRALVEAVSDDKSLRKEERKRLQVHHAAALAPEAADIKVADKTANVRDIAMHPPTGWSLERRLEYLDWADSVVSNLPQAVAPGARTLRELFVSTIAQARATLRNQKGETSE